MAKNPHFDKRFDVVISRSISWGEDFVVLPINAGDLKVPDEKLECLPVDIAERLKKIAIQNLHVSLGDRTMPRYKIAFAVPKKKLTQRDGKLKDRIVHHEFYFTRKRERSEDLHSEENAPPRFSRKAESKIREFQKGKYRRARLPLYVDSYAIGQFVHQVNEYVSREAEKNIAILKWKRSQFQWIAEVVNWRVRIDLGPLLSNKEDALTKPQIRSINQYFSLKP